jgi:hypothetical protein
METLARSVVLRPEGHFHGPTLMNEQNTLGFKLTATNSSSSSLTARALLLKGLYSALNLSLVMAFLSLITLWLVAPPNVADVPVLMLCGTLAVAWVILNLNSSPRSSKQHPLLTNDRQGFMFDLRLDAKTAIVDGNNIYHFGLENGLEANALKEIVRTLRSDGYRIVTFFDANIFFRLIEYGTVPKDSRHSVSMLEDAFGLVFDEVYVVPSGVQADRYILESLNLLPVSFAVTNDKFRDYANEYKSVMEAHGWRKGVMISQNKIRLR